jgi:hypothetical protein
MQFIENIIEPETLVMTWQSLDKDLRKRFVIAELKRIDEHVSLKYLTESKDFKEAVKNGFAPYPAFPNVKDTYESGVLDALMRRLPPNSRADYTKYIEGFRLQPSTPISDFALLGYTGAKLPSDGFAIIHPFNDVNEPFELLVESAGYRYYKDNVVVKDQDPVSFRLEFDSLNNEQQIEILFNDDIIGYVTRALVPSFSSWINSKWIREAKIEKINGTIEHPILYVYVIVDPCVR